ncbi:MAG: tyrosine--tRNA ligase [bacterium]|nr:tyrosine--tRNA ligase [bacterium]
MSNTLLTKNITEVLPSKADLEKRLSSAPIKIYLGIDPSAPILHLGHAVVLRKLREFQDTGHKIILLVGDFTGMIGDPSDRTAARKKLTREEVRENAKTYKEQAEKILRFSGKNPVEIKFNSEWLSKLTFEEVVELASNVTVQQMLERDFFQKRLQENKPIHLHEFLYPLMQGYDSVALDVDAEIGGTDQTFNMLVGRTLMKTLKGKEKFVISVPLLEGLDGRKMSKSFGNFVAITDPPTDMFGKIMSVNDNLVDRYFELATQLSFEEIQSIKQENTHPMDLKKRLSLEIVKLYHGEKAADKAKDEFQAVFREGEGPTDAVVYKTATGSVNLITVLVEAGMVQSNSEARRLIAQGGVEWEGEKVRQETLEISGPGTLRVGKHRFLKIEMEK